MIRIFASRYKFGEHYARYELQVPRSECQIHTQARFFYGLRPGTPVYLVLAPRYEMSPAERREYDEVREVLFASKVTYIQATLP